MGAEVESGGSGARAVTGVLGNRKLRRKKYGT